MTQKENRIWGPIFLLATLAFGAKTSIPFDLLLLAIAGLYLSATYQVRGCVYSLILLGLSACFKHAFFTSDHLWQLGIEGSLALAFFITALAFEQAGTFIDSLHSQIETRKAALENIEEDLSKLQQEFQTTQIGFQEKVSGLQKELEDLQTEHSTILILNEVLRKTTARHVQENEDLTLKYRDLYGQMDLLKSEYEQSQSDLALIKNSDAVVILNKQLMKELNAARYDKEQTHLINETLARLYARENLKAKEADQEAASLEEQLSASRKQIEKIEVPLKEQITQAAQEIETLRFQFERANIEANQARAQLLKLNETQTERNFLRERLQAAQEEIALLEKKQPKETMPQEKMVHLMQIEPLFKQLKKQFDEKNQVLNQTRTELFKVDTELQKLRVERQAIELNPLPKEVEEELCHLSSQVVALEEENQQLQELISLLSDNSQDAAKRKKKLKTQSSPDQDLLF